MTDPGSHHSEVVRPVNDPTTFAMEMVRSEMRRGFEGLDKRLDSMVTREAHDATVRRLDDADAQIRRDQAAHEREAERRFDLVEQSVSSGDRAILDRLEQEHTERRKTRRWVIGTVVAVTALAISATALLLNYLL